MSRHWQAPTAWLLSLLVHSEIPLELDGEEPDCIFLGGLCDLSFTLYSSMARLRCRLGRFWKNGIQRTHALGLRLL